MSRFLFECILSITLKLTLPPSDWRLMIPNVFFSFWLIVEAAIHFCPLYVMYAIFVKLHVIPVDPVMKEGDKFAGAFFGPECIVTIIRQKSAERALSLSIKCSQVSPMHIQSKKQFLYSPSNHTDNAEEIGRTDGDPTQTQVKEQPPSITADEQA